MATRFHGPTFAVIMALFDMVIGAIFIFQDSSSFMERIFGVNMVCAGIYLTLWIIKAIKHHEECKDISCAFWIAFFTMFQLWEIMPIYMHASDQWRERIDKCCYFMWAAFGVFMVVSVVASLISAA